MLHQVQIPQRIGFVIFNLTGGGAERVVLNLANMFQKRGIDIHIILLEDTVSYSIESFTIHTLGKKRKKSKIFRKKWVQILANTLKRTIDDIESDGMAFDAIFSNLPAADEVVSFANLNHQVFYVMHTAYSFEIEEMRKRKAYLRAYRKGRYYKKLYRNKALISVSMGVAKDIELLGIHYASNSVIYNPFDFDLIKEEGEKKVFDIPEEPYILVAAAFRKEKRIDIALEAYKKVPEAPKLKILSKKNPALLLLIEKMGLSDRVEVLDFQKNPYPFMKHAKLLVLSSEREGLPTVLIESLILHTPIVSTDCISGPNEIMRGELKQYLAKVNDSEDLSEKIAMALKCYPEIDDQMFVQFREDRIYHEYCKIVKQCKDKI